MIPIGGTDFSLRQTQTKSQPQQPRRWLHPSAQGCRTRLRWGRTRAKPESIVGANPKGVAASVAVTQRHHVSLCIILGQMAQPLLGLGPIAIHIPR